MPRRAGKWPDAPMTARTARLRFEALAESHAAAMLSVLADDRIYTYIPDTPHRDLASLRERYRLLAAGSPSPDVQWWNFIVRLDGSDLPIGVVQATLQLPERLADVGYLLSPTHWGRGHATEAVGWLVRRLEQRGDIDIFRARIDARNLRSIAVVRRLGFHPVEAGHDGAPGDLVFDRRRGQEKAAS